MEDDESDKFSVAADVASICVATAASSSAVAERPRVSQKGRAMFLACL